jgi:hypothetical protein
LLFSLYFSPSHALKDKEKEEALAIVFTLVKKISIFLAFILSKGLASKGYA